MNVDCAREGNEGREMGRKLEEEEKEEMKREEKRKEEEERHGSRIHMKK